MTASAVVGKADSQDEACPVDYSQHFGHEGQARQLASLRVLLSAFTGVPGIIGLHGGLPPADAFPFTEMAFTLRDGTKMEIKDPAQVQPYTATTAFKTSDHSRVYSWLQNHCTINRHLMWQSNLLPVLSIDLLLCAGGSSSAIQCYLTRLPCSARVGEEAYLGSTQSSRRP